MSEYEKVIMEKPKYCANNSDVRHKVDKSLLVVKAVIEHRIIHAVAGCTFPFFLSTRSVYFI